MSEIHSASPLTKLKDLAPHEVLELLAQILRLFPPEFQHRVKTIIDTLPATGDNMQKILEVVRAQWKGIQSQDRLQIAIVGASQTGKTTLLNAIEEGQSPGSPTIFSVVETPGLEEFLGFRNSRRLPDELEQADLILLLLDSRYDVSEQTHKLVRRLKGLGKPLLVALNKCDLISNHSEAAKKAQKTLGERTVAVSAFRTRTLEQLFRSVVASYATALYLLASSFPGFRKTICHGIATQAAIGSSLVGAIPIPISDLLPIMAIQTSMVLKIARAYGHRIDRNRARELIPMLLSGLVMREASHRLRRQFPEKAKLIGLSAAGIGTYFLGRGTISYFDRFSSLLGEKEFPRSVPAAVLHSGR